MRATYLKQLIPSCGILLKCHERADGTLPTTAVRKNLDCKNLSPLNVTRAFPSSLFPLPLSVADLCKCRAYAGYFHEVSAMHAMQSNLLQAHNLRDVWSQPPQNIFPCPVFSSPDAISRLGSAAECHHFFQLPCRTCVPASMEIFLSNIVTTSGI